MGKKWGKASMGFENIKQGGGAFFV